MRHYFIWDSILRHYLRQYTWTLYEVIFLKIMWGGILDIMQSGILRHYMRWYSKTLYKVVFLDTIRGGILGHYMRWYKCCPEKTHNSSLVVFINLDLGQLMHQVSYSASSLCDSPQRATWEFEKFWFLKN